MKKTIVIIILAVYIASIAIVNFFGLEVNNSNVTTYVSRIQCDSILLHGENSRELFPTTYQGDIPVFVFTFIPPPLGETYTADPESVLKNPNIIQLNYEVFPHLADEASVKYEYNEGAGVAVFHELSSTFVLLQPNKIFTVTIRATDGSNVSTQVRIMAQYIQQQK